MNTKNIMSVVKIPLSSKSNANKFATVSEVDADKISRHKWYLKLGRNTFYAHAHIDGQWMSMHKFIIGDVPKGYVIDHSDRNGLSNSQQNLRVVTLSQNSHNIALRGGTSMYRGVSWSQITGKWHARVGGQHFGYFDDEEEASRTADKAALLLYGDVAQLNAEYSDEEMSELQLEGFHVIIQRELPTGVVQRGKKFLAQITINKQYTNLGMFDNAQEAHVAYLDKKNQETGRMIEMHNSRPIVRNDDGVAVIDIHDKHGTVIEQALVDDEDWHHLTLTSWSLLMDTSLACQWPDVLYAFHCPARNI